MINKIYKISNSLFKKYLVYNFFFVVDYIRNKTIGVLKIFNKNIFYNDHLKWITRRFFILVMHDLHYLDVVNVEIRVVLFPELNNLVDEIYIGDFDIMKSDEVEFYKNLRYLVYSKIKGLDCKQVEFIEIKYNI